LFTARSTAAAAASGAASDPPILGHGYLASKLIGRPVQVHCVSQSQPARAQPGTLLMSKETCGTLIGYAVAQPHEPKAGTKTGLQVSTTAFAVLHVIARMAGATAAQTDCHALELFDRGCTGSARHPARPQRSAGHSFARGDRPPAQAPAKLPDPLATAGSGTS
jgi:hypothetical protein